MADERDACNNNTDHGSLNKKKGKQRGPYNQYLSQPEAKVPRTTLRNWPDKKFATSSSSSTESTYTEYTEVNTCIADPMLLNPCWLSA